MGRKKKSAGPAPDPDAEFWSQDPGAPPSQGPPVNMGEGYTWCPNCQASYQGEVCPGCSPERHPENLDPGLGQHWPLKERETPASAAESGVFEGGEGQGQGYEGDPGVEAPPDPTTLAEVAEQASTEITTITEILPVPLTDAEYKEFGILVSRANQEIAQAEDELKSVKSQYKSRIDSAEARRNEYAAIINAGHQRKQVECHLVKDFQENTITLIRLDTGDVVRTRTMTAAEKQRGLDFND